MSTGIATLAQIDLPWLLRALRSAGFVESTINEEEDAIRLVTELGKLRVSLLERSAVLGIATVVGTSDQLPFEVLARTAEIRRVQVELTYARLSFYPDAERLFLEYEVPLLAGLGRPQFLAVLRGFLADLAIVRREGIGRVTP